MQLEQAIFTSTRSRSARGYHLVAQSEGIHEELARRLIHWGPSHDSLLQRDVAATSVSFFPADEAWCVIARSGYGGPEYSARGSLQVVTRMLVVRMAQLVSYDYCPLRLFRVAMALGHLRLLYDPPEHLPEITLPTDTWIGSPPSRPADDAQDALLGKALDILSDQGRIAICNTNHRLELVERLLGRMQPTERPWLSFTTGLKPSRHRQFRVHLTPTEDAQITRQLMSQGIVCIH